MLFSAYYAQNYAGIIGSGLAMATNSCLHNGAVFSSKSTHFKGDTHEVESTNQLSPIVMQYPCHGLPYEQYLAN